jgi:hypothetical protein
MMEKQIVDNTARESDLVESIFTYGKTYAAHFDHAYVFTHPTKGNWLTGRTI